jgi:hypothetical protein
MNNTIGENDEVENTFTRNVIVRCERCHDNYAEVGSKLCQNCDVTLKVTRINELKSIKRKRMADMRTKEARERGKKK